jgi:hypothetical protein
VLLIVRGLPARLADASSALMERALRAEMERDQLREEVRRLRGLLEDES